MEFDPSEYVARKNMTNWVPGSLNGYISKYYPDLQIIFINQPEFSIWTPPLTENDSVIPVKIHLPNNLSPFTVNNIMHGSSTLKCVGVDVISEGGKIDKARQKADPSYPTHEIFSNGVYQICSFNTPGQDVTEIEFRYKRWEENRLIAIARMASIHENRPSIALITTTNYIPFIRCGGPIFVDS